MFSPSDYNDAVPQFTNGNYANSPLSPLYIEEPGAVDYNRGMEPIQTLPAQWWNWLCNQFTARLNKLNVYVKNIFDELANLLSLVGETPSGTEEEITTGQIKGMFQTLYPQYLGANFVFESVLQGRTSGVMIPPTDSWSNNTDTLSLTGGFGVINNCFKVEFGTCELVLPNDSAIHYIVSDSNGVISIEDSLAGNVILVGLCHDKEYCLLVDNNVNQCKNNIILKKWFGQNKITQDFVAVLQTYYNTLIASIETEISIKAVSSGFIGINGGTFNNCTISIDTINNSSSIYGINNSTLNNCIVSINDNSGYGINNSTLNNCTISINIVRYGRGIGGGAFNNCNISINIVMIGKVGVHSGTYKYCTISVGVAQGVGVSNTSSVILYFTDVVGSSISSLSDTGGKLNVLNGTVLHAS